MYNIKFVYLFHENVSPALFAKIIRPSVAGQWIMSVPALPLNRRPSSEIWGGCYKKINLSLRLPSGH